MSDPKSETPRLTREQIEGIRRYAEGGSGWPDGAEIWPTIAALCDLALQALAATPRAEHTEGVVVPVEPTEEMWSGLARDIVMWRDLSIPTGDQLHLHLRRSGTEIPEWLAHEIPDTRAVPSKGTVAVCIYKAMLAAAPSPSSKNNSKGDLAGGSKDEHTEQEGAAGECGCLRCAKEREAREPTSAWPFPVEARRMFVCAICGNKRCPHSDDHRNACTGSNEPGQPGSRYPSATPATAEQQSENRAGGESAADQLERRLNWLEETFRHCPHAELRYNSGNGVDDDEYDDGEPVPRGWSIRILGCSPMRVTAQTFPDLIEAAMAWETRDDDEWIDASRTTPADSRDSADSVHKSNEQQSSVSEHAQKEDAAGEKG